MVLAWVGSSWPELGVPFGQGFKGSQPGLPRWTRSTLDRELGQGTQARKALHDKKNHMI